jgi:hypothetical protein
MRKRGCEEGEIIKSTGGRAKNAHGMGSSENFTVFALKTINYLIKGIFINATL